MMITDLLCMGCWLLYFLYRKFPLLSTGTWNKYNRYVFFLFGSCLLYGRLLYLTFHENSLLPYFALFLFTGITAIILLTIFYRTYI